MAEPVETNPIYEETVVDELISEDERRAREEKKISDAELPEEGEELNGDSGERGPLLP